MYAKIAKTIKVRDQKDRIEISLVAVFNQERHGDSDVFNQEGHGDSEIE